MVVNILVYVIFSLIINYILFFYFKKINFNIYIVNTIVILIICLINKIFILYLILIILCLIILIVDTKYMIIPDFILFLLLIYYLFLYKYNISIIEISKEKIKLGIIIILFSMIIHLLVLNIFKIELIGFGDLKLLFIFNLYIGFYGVLFVLFISSLIGCVFEIFIFQRKIFPFGPYLVISFLFVMLLI